MTSARPKRAMLQMVTVSTDFFKRNPHLPKEILEEETQLPIHPGARVRKKKNRGDGVSVLDACLTKK